MKYDVAVIGGGTAGYAASIALARRGKSVALIERNRIGGVCVNYGCVPAIFLYDVSFLYSRSVEIANYKGLYNEIELDNFFQKRDEIIEYLSSAGRKLIENAGGEIIEGEAELVSRNAVKVGSTVVEADKVVLATGTSPKRPNVEGVENAISEDEATRLNYVPASMVVIGGGVGAVELAQIYARLGSFVTLVSRSKVLKFLTDNARRILLESLDFDGVKVVEEASVKRINCCSVQTDKGTFEGDVIVYAVGRVSNIPKGSDRVGIKYDENGILVNDKLETNVPGVYAIGDVTNRQAKLAHLAYLDAMVLAVNLTGGNERVDYTGVPMVIYTDPMVAVAGDRQKVKRYVSFPFNANTRAIIKGLREGFVTLGLDDSGTIVYAEVVGDDAEELIGIASLAIRKGMHVRELAFTALPHPSLSEALVNAARAYFDLDVDSLK